MDNDTNATERPWRVEPAGGGEILIIAPRKGFNRNGVENEWAIARVGDEGLWDEDDPKHSKEDEANAELIVRAVNSYDPALQDKLTKAVKALEECATPFTLPNPDDLNGDALEKSVAIFRCLVEHALAVQTAANTVLRSIKESE